jgi:hypothetical protein
VVVAGLGIALGTWLGISRIEERVDVAFIASLECSGFFEAPMTPLLHGQTPDPRPTSLASLTTCRDRNDTCGRDIFLRATSCGLGLFRSERSRPA